MKRFVLVGLVAVAFFFWTAASAMAGPLAFVRERIQERRERRHEARLAVHSPQAIAPAPATAVVASVDSVPLLVPPKRKVIAAGTCPGGVCPVQ